jgi:hypothetical protein
MIRFTGHAYDLQTGEISAERYTGSTREFAMELTPTGTGFIEGQRDHLRERVDLETGSVVSWESPKLAAFEREQRRSLLRARMSQIDVLKARPIGALLLDPNSQADRDRLAGLEGELARLRAALAELN